jgi:crossover junction endodeoxyribonuclease RuvC
MASIRILGIDPGLRRTGWGVIDYSSGRLSHVANGVLQSDGKADLAIRLCQLYDGLTAILQAQQPGEVAVESIFVNKDAAGTLKLAQARAIALLVPAQADLPVYEYAPNVVKKTVVGVGHAAKEQINHMIRLLLPGAVAKNPDAADALAIAICHAHQTGGRTRELLAAVKR